MGIAIMAHPLRRAWAEELADVLSAEIVWDEKSNVWDTGRRSLQVAAQSGPYALVVQDDAILAPDFLAAAERVHDRYPDFPVSFYAGAAARKAFKSTISRRRSYFMAWGPRWGVATMTPSAEVDDLISYCDEIPLDNYDLRMTEYWTYRRKKCAYTVPCLVDHRPVEENPSLANAKRTNSRQAAWFTQGSAMGYNW